MLCGQGVPDQAVRVGDFFEPGIGKGFEKWARHSSPSSPRTSGPKTGGSSLKGPRGAARRGPRNLPVCDVEFVHRPRYASGPPFGVAKAYMSRVGEGPFPTEIG